MLPPSRSASPSVPTATPRVLPFLVLAGIALGAPAGAAAATPPPFTPGAPSLGDSLFPTIGNGGYDARHYDLDLDYAVAEQRLQASVTIDAVATQALSRFGLDLTAWNVVSRVAVDGRPARFTVDAERSKLLVTPPRGLRDGRSFRTVVRYSGIQRPFPKTSGLVQGWQPDPQKGAVVVDQPLGAMGWFPSNNVPADKATYTTRVTVPRGFSALGAGVLTARADRGRDAVGTSTFVWDESAPTSTYLVPLAIGRFDVNALDPATPQRTTPTAARGNRPVPFYTAVDPDLTAGGKAQSTKDLNRSQEVVDFYSTYYGVRYPFTSLGGIVSLQSFSLGLETQSKPTYAVDDFDRGFGPGVDLVAHELAHSFFGNLVTPARWRDLWLSEGMTVFSTWLWSEAHGDFPTTPREQYLDVYANATYPIDWRVAPADPQADDLFDRDGIYRRAPATIEAIREILGDARFVPMMRRWLTEHAYGSATTEQFIDLVQRTDPTRSARWTAFFRQWLSTSYPAPEPGQPVAKPQINADNFDRYPLTGEEG